MFIIYHAGCYARMLARELRVTSVFPNERITSRRRNALPFFVNWGCGPTLLNFMRFSEGAEIWNRDISGSVHKMRTFELLSVAGLPHPRATRDPHELSERGRYLGRTDGLTGGLGITIYERGQLPGAGVRHDFYTQIVAKRLEIRLHVVNGAVICEQFKLIPRGSNVLIRNFDNGARFSARPLEERLSPEDANRAREIAIEATVACGLQFAALDMALTQRGGWVIFELNSAPGITPREDEGEPHGMPSSYEAYLNYFRQFVRGSSHKV